MSDRKPTQANAIKSALLAGSRVDSVMAFGLGITRLAAIIKRLRNGGLPVVTEQDKGNGLARYRLPDNWHGGDAEQSTLKCCDSRPSELTSETDSPLSASIPTNWNNPT